MRIRNFSYRTKVLLFVIAPVVVVALGMTGWQLMAASKAEAEDPFKALGVQRLQKKPKAPPFALPDVNGNTVRLANFKGKAILLNFFATWCTPCKWEMPEMEQLHQAYKDKGFTVLAISIDRSRKLIPPFTKELNLTFPILHDPDLQVARRYAFRGPPLSYLIDAQGRVIGGAAGPRNWNNKAAQRIIETLITDSKD